MNKIILLLFFLSANTFSAFAQPTVAASDPICDQADVISMFSNVYTDVPVDTWLTPWSQAPVTLTDLQIAGNDTKLYQDVTFLGIETVGPNLIDASGLAYFNISMWTDNATQFRIKLVDFGADGGFGGGDDSEHEITFDNPTQNAWNSYSIPFSDFTGLQSREHLAQLILSAAPNGIADFYIDNVYYSSSACIVAAPAPTCPAGDVISMFSNTYTDVPVTTWLTPWSQAPVTLTDLDIAGNDLKLYQDVTFLGIETTGADLIDASGMQNFHIDFWSGNATQFRVKLVDFGPDGGFGGGDDSEHELTFNNPAQNTWISYELPLSSFVGLNSTEHLAQYILSAMPNGEADFYIDNMYFSNCSNPVDVELCVDMSCFPAVQVPSVFGQFNGWCANCDFITDPDGDGVYCATVQMAPGDQQYKFFDQLQGPEEFATVGACNISNGFGINRLIVVEPGTPQSVTFGWETCDPTCIPPLPPPDLPITFDDPDIDYNLANFGDPVAMDAVIGVDPLDPTNQVVCATKPAGAPCWAGTVVGDSGLENPIPFAADNLVMTIDVFSPEVGTEFLLKVEDANNASIASEVLAFTTVANQWETLVFNFANGNPAINLANTYSKVVVFAEFTCATDNAPGTGLTHYFDNIMMCVPGVVAITCPPTSMGTGCSAADVVPFADFAAFEAAGGSAVDADPTSFMLISTTESGTCPVTVVNTYEIADVCGVNTVTCEHTTLVEAPSGPIVTCPADQVVTCFEDIVADPSNLVVTTSCGSTFTAYVKQPLITGGLPGCDGTVYTYIYKAVDECGRVGECQQQFLIQNAAPTVTVPAGGTVECFSDIVVSPSDATVDADCLGDNVINVLGPVISGPANCPGSTYTYTYRVKDACNRIVEVDRVFTIQNFTAPVITSVIETLTTTCLAGVNPSEDFITYETACGDDATVNITGPQTIGAMDCNGTRYRYTYTVTDACGRNSIPVTLDYVVQNDGPTFAGCEDDQWLQFNCEDYGGEDGTISAIEAYIASVSASSACGNDLTVFNNFNSNNINTCINNGINTITFRATDNCGRTSFCTTTYVVVDTEAPSIYEEAQDHWEICNYDTPANFDDWVDSHGGAEAIDGCSSSSVFWSTIPSNPSFNCDGATGVTSTTVTFRVRDNCGNTSTTTATFNAFMTGTDIAEQGDEMLSVDEGTEFLLHQNQPNPFKETTMIGFNLPESGVVTLEIFDVSGRLIHNVKGEYATGYNQFNVNRSELPNAGILYYRVNTATDSKTKKMILLD